MNNRSLRSRLIVIALTIIFFATTNCSVPDLREEAYPAKEHEAFYKSKLQEYSNALRPGMTRGNVEAYFMSKRMEFRQMCCIDEKSAFADLVLIGKEKPPWWCGQYNAYIAFQFAATNPRPQKIPVVNDDSDVLTRITIYYWPENCL